mgnify:FL=1
MEQHKHPEMAIETVLQYNAEHNQKYVLHLIGDAVCWNSYVKNTIIKI